MWRLFLCWFLVSAAETTIGSSLLHLEVRLDRHGRSEPTKKVAFHLGKAGHGKGGNAAAIQSVGGLSAEAGGWALVALGRPERGLFLILHVASNKTLDIRQGQVSAGTEVWLYRRHGGLSQRWQVCIPQGEHSNGEQASTSNMTLGALRGRAVVFRSALNGLVLDVKAGRAEDGTRVQTWPFNDSPSQRWLLGESSTSEEGGRFVVSVHPIREDEPWDPGAEDTEDDAGAEGAEEENMCELDGEWLEDDESKLNDMDRIRQEWALAQSVVALRSDACQPYDHDFFDHYDYSEAWEKLHSVSVMDNAMEESWAWAWVRSLHQTCACALSEAVGGMLHEAIDRLQQLLDHLEENLGLEATFVSGLAGRWSWLTASMYQSHSYPDPAAAAVMKGETAGMADSQGWNLQTELHAGLDLARFHLSAPLKLRSLLLSLLSQQQRQRPPRDSNTAHSPSLGGSEQSTEGRGLVIAHYYASRKDPQRKCSVGYNRPWYIFNWSSSVASLGLDALLCHDGLSDDFQASFHDLHGDAVRFKYVNLSRVQGPNASALSPNDVRFLVSLDILRERWGDQDEVSSKRPAFVLLTDVNDVALRRDPFQFMRLMSAQYDLFVGDEHDGSMAYMLDVLYRCYRSPEERKAIRSSGTIFNTGVIGGKFEAVMWLLESMVRELTSLSKRHHGLPSNVCDMAVFNRILWDLVTHKAFANARTSRSNTSSSDSNANATVGVEPSPGDEQDHCQERPPRFRVFSGYPFVSPFKGKATPGTAWHYAVHK